jgi:hypothetical protein
MILFIAVSAFAAGKTDEKESKAKKSSKPKAVKINDEYVNKILKDLTDKLKKDSKKSKKMHSTELSIFASNLEIIEKYPDIEIETGIYRKWYKHMTDVVRYLAKAKRVEKTAQLSNNNRHYAQAVEAYKKYLEGYKQLIKNKKKYKISEEKMDELIKKKKEAERRRRAARRKSRRR